MPLAGMVPMLNMQLGEVVFGGVDAGLYGMLMMAILAVFIARTDGRADARVHRQEDRGLRGQDGDARHPGPGSQHPRFGLASVGEWGTKTANNPGAHGFSEILYLFSSQAGNNGSAFMGSAATTRSTTRPAAWRC